MTKEEIIQILESNSNSELVDLGNNANLVRQKSVGNKLLRRGILEISNICMNSCLYCGIRKQNTGVKRYLMSLPQILSSVDKIARSNCNTVVIQSGESEVLTRSFITSIIKIIKEKTNLAVTLSMGEKSYSDYAEWKEAGADRYYLRFETSSNYLYKKYKPDLKTSLPGRIKNIENLYKLGFEVGSGIMVGLPGQSISNLADDLILINKLNLSMIGIGPYIPHPSTPLQTINNFISENQVSCDPNIILKCIALTRLMNTSANIPVTTGFASICKNAYSIGLGFGANVIMTNFTPPEYRKLYDIYPDRICNRSEVEKESKHEREF